MLQFAVKVALTAVLVVAVAELAKRNALWAALIAALPLTSLLAFIWFYLETGDSARIAEMSNSIVWLVLASLPLFLLLPVMLRAGWGFWPSLGIACATSAVTYLGVAWMLGRLGTLT